MDFEDLPLILHNVHIIKERTGASAEFLETLADKITEISESVRHDLHARLQQADDGEFEYHRLITKLAAWLKTNLPGFEGHQEGMSGKEHFEVYEAKRLDNGSIVVLEIFADQIKGEILQIRVKSSENDQGYRFFSVAPQGSVRSEFIQLFKNIEPAHKLADIQALTRTFGDKFSPAASK